MSDRRQTLIDDMRQLAAELHGQAVMLEAGADVLEDLAKTERNKEELVRAAERAREHGVMLPF